MNPKDTALALDDLFNTLEEGDFFHNDARKDAAHDKASRPANKQAPAAACPAGQMRNKATGHCTSVRGKLQR